MKKNGSDWGQPELKPVKPNPNSNPRVVFGFGFQFGLARMLDVLDGFGFYWVEADLKILIFLVCVFGLGLHF